MLLLIALVLVTLASAMPVDVRGGICPFKKDALAKAKAQEFDSPHMCNVTVIGSNLCACFGSDHCGGGCGCLVPSGSCNSASCAFPRVCFCAKVGGQTQNGADCSPVDSGPCTVCIAKSTNVVKATPVKALYTEFSRISDAQIDERMRSVNLETSGSFNNKVQRLAEHVHMLESKK